MFAVGGGLGVGCVGWWGGWGWVVGSGEMFAVGGVGGVLKLNVGMGGSGVGLGGG